MEPDRTSFDSADASCERGARGSRASGGPGLAMSFLELADGTRLRLSDRGAGPAIVLVHGWKMSHRIWDRVVPALETSFRVVSFDLRGMGESDKPPGPYDFEQLANDLGQVISRLELEDVTLVGWSMGCSVSLEYLARSGAHVGRLALVNGPLRLTRTEDFPWTMTEGELAAYIESVEHRWPEGEYEFTRATFRKPVPHVVSWIYSIALQTPLDVILKTVRAQATLDHRGVLSKLEIPVLAVYGRHDPYYPPELAAYIARTAPRGSALILEESAHFPFLEPDSSRFNEAIAALAAGARAAAALPGAGLQQRD
jgi:pimeloyl-ACP methyl ester carboxylesterase